MELLNATAHLVPVGEVTDIDDEPQADARHASAMDQSRPAETDERATGRRGARAIAFWGSTSWRAPRAEGAPRCCRALMRVAHECKCFAQLHLLIHKILSLEKFSGTAEHPSRCGRTWVTAAPLCPVQRTAGARNRSARARTSCFCLRRRSTRHRRLKPDLRSATTPVQARGGPDGPHTSGGPGSPTQHAARCGRHRAVLRPAGAAQASGLSRL